MTENRCEFYLASKKRTCRMEKVNGEKYCHTHIQQSKETKGARIPCPYDNRHTIYEKDLQKHIKKCPLYLIQKQQQSQPYYVPNINRNEVENEKEEEGEVSNEIMQKVIQKLYLLFSDSPELSSLLFKYFNEVDSPQISSITSNTSCIIPMSNSNDHQIVDQQNIKNIKHHHQIHQILGFINHQIALSYPDHSLNSDRKLVIEFGAGKAQLSTYFHQLHPNYAHLLIDYKKNFKNKFERKEEDKDSAFFRIHIDIRDLHLEKSLKYFLEKEANVNSVEEDRKSGPHDVFSIAKHLCGGALDMSLLSIVNTLNGSDYRSKFIVFASCCHHRCNWSSYCNRQYLEQIGFDRSTFRALCKLSSWAVSIELNDYQKCSKIENNNNDNNININNNDPIRNGNFDVHSLENWQKVQIGRMSKLLIDHGRRLFLNANLYSSSIYRFVGHSFTKENCLLFAERKL